MLLTAVTLFFSLFGAWAVGRLHDRSESKRVLALAWAKLVLGLLITVYLGFSQMHKAVPADQLAVNKTYWVASEFRHAKDGDPFKLENYAVITDGEHFQTIRLALHPGTTNDFGLKVVKTPNLDGGLDSVYLTKFSRMPGTSSFQ